ncbi:MAG: glycoside hydrolase [Eubacterium sp.]
MKKVLSLFLSIVMLFSIFVCFETTAYAATKSYTTGSLNATLDTSSGLLTLSGTGKSADYSSATSVPWIVYRSTIKNIVIEDGVTGLGKNLFASCTNLETVVFGNNVTTIGESAFSGCTGSTFWLDIPASTTSIASKAFYKTNFNYVKFFSPSITIADDAFSDKDGNGTYARFFGLHDSGARAFVQKGQSNGYDWHYYCIEDDGQQIEGGYHDYQTITYAPTCTQQGYDWYGCIYCDAEPYTSNFTDPINHNYRYSGTNGSSIIYTCSNCGQSDLALDVFLVQSEYLNAISHDNDNAPYNQSNYDGMVDVYLDGYINAKDFLFVKNLIKTIDTTNTQTTIDENTVYQTMEGFGASAAWWSQDVGGWENVDEITELLYSKENGIGLNIYRYNLGGGSEDDTHISDWRRRAEDFLSDSSDINNSSTYDWDADVNARNALASAQKANADLKVTLFSNSAPVSITDNGFAYCSKGATKNLSQSNYQAFANYVVNCAEHFIDEGYNVTSVSPINEPEWAWAADENGNCSQEGCHWEYSDALNFYNNYMVPALKNSSKLNGKVDLSIWESGQLNYSVKENVFQTTYVWNNFLNSFFSSDSSYSSANANIRSYVDSVDTHSYWAGTSDRTAVASQLSGSNYSAVQKVRCTEYCQMTNDGNTGVYDLIQQEGTTNGMTIDYGIAMADIIYQDLTILNAVEWDWWTACSGGIYPDGLVYINYNDHSAIQTSKRLWCLGNFSKFIDEGAQRISVSTASAVASTVEECAFLNPDGNVVIVYINKGDTNQYTTFDNAQYSAFETYVTDEAHDLDRYQYGSVAATPVSIPAKSVTTVVLEK